MINPKQYQMTKIPMTKRPLTPCFRRGKPDPLPKGEREGVRGNLKIRISDLFRISNFVLRIFIYLACIRSSFAQDFTYTSRGKRDPFVPLVGAGAVYQVKEAADISSIEDVVLEGILYDSKGGSIAIINGIILKEGDQAGIITVDKIEPKKAILHIEDNAYEVFLGKEKGGEGE